MIAGIETRINRSVHWLWIPVILVICVVTGLLLAKFSAKSSILLVFSISATLAFLYWPRFALYGLLILSPFYFILNDFFTSGSFSGLITHISILDYLTMAAVVGVSWKYLTNPSIYRGRLSGEDIFCLLWLAMVIISLAYGLSQGFEAALRSSRGPLMFVLYFVAVAELNSSGRLRELGWVILISSYMVSVVGLLAVAGYLTPYFPALPVGLVGDSGYLTRPNFFVEPALTIPNIVFLFLHFRFKGIRSKHKILMNTIIALALILNIMLLALSVTRGFWLGMIAALLTSLVLMSRYFNFMKAGRILKVVAFASFTAIAFEVVLNIFFHVSLYSVIFGRLSLIISGNDPTSEFRLNEFQIYYQSFLESPLIGNGFGSSLDISTEFASLGFAHNQYIWLLQVTGIFGVVFLGGFLLLGVVNALKMLSTTASDGLPEMMNVMFLSTLAGFMVVSFTSPELSNPTTVPMLITLFGMSRAIYARSQHADEASRLIQEPAKNR